jgi:DNA methylase
MNIPDSVPVTHFENGRIRLILDGTCWVNIGDCYASTETGRADAASLNPSLQRHQRSRHDRRFCKNTGLPAKNLVGVPWRLALAMQQDGWLRSSIIWHKPNAMPESVVDWVAVSHEYLFLFTRSARYWFDLDPIRQPHRKRFGPRLPVGGTRGRDAILGSANRTASGKPFKYGAAGPAFRGHPDSAYHATGRQHDRAHPKGRNPGSVWSISTRPCREAHFATFPLDIPLRCISSGAKPAVWSVTHSAAPQPPGWPPANSAAPTSASTYGPSFTTLPCSVSATIWAAASLTSRLRRCYWEAP